LAYGRHVGAIQHDLAAPEDKYIPFDTNGKIKAKERNTDAMTQRISAMDCCHFGECRSEAILQSVHTSHSNPA
jgi:hypothetical protein